MRLIGCERGVGFLDQSRSLVKQNQCNARELSTFSWSLPHSDEVLCLCELKVKLYLYCCNPVNSTTFIWLDVCLNNGIKLLVFLWVYNIDRFLSVWYNLKTCHLPYKTWTTLIVDNEMISIVRYSKRFNRRNLSKRSPLINFNALTL